MSKTSTFFYFLDNRETKTGLFIKPSDFLNEEFSEFESVSKVLNSLKLEPSKKSLEKIMDYSRKIN